jgi:uncharacterized protein
MSDVQEFSKNSVVGFLHLPEKPNGDGLILTHGAGANCQAPILRTVAQVFVEHGFVVLRFQLPFRQRRPTGPPFPAQAQADREGIAAALAEVKALAPGRVFAGGHSYGGRQTSMAAAEKLIEPDALLLLSYPLHPPKKPEQMRTAHFPELHTPALFVHGSRDPFGSVAELESATRLIPAQTRLSVIEGKGHNLASGRFEIPALVLDPLKGLRE